jgi:membrane protein implicated in regulation of membrane protease activity
MPFWMFWLILGVVFCFAEIVFPTAFIEFAMGVSALLVSLISLYIDNFAVQAFLWLCLSTAIAIAARKLAPRRRVRTLEDASEAETLTPIAPGQKGRALYEGNSWFAYCEDPEMALPARLKVEVIRREGNTLVVMPPFGFVPRSESHPISPPEAHPPQPDQRDPEAH